MTTPLAGDGCVNGDELESPAEQDNRGRSVQYHTESLLYHIKKNFRFLFTSVNDMRLKVATDIALRVLMLTGTTGEKMTIDGLAERLAVQRSHLAKVVQRLQHQGLLETVRGRTGGVQLATAALDVRLGGLIRDLEGDDEVVSCDAPPTCPLAGACRLRGALRRAQNAFYDSLDGVTVGELIVSPTRELLLSLS